MTNTISWFGEDGTEAGSDEYYLLVCENGIDAGSDEYYLLVCGGRR